MLTRVSLPAFKGKCEFGPLGPLGYNSNAMDAVPFYRRAGFRIFVLLAPLIVGYFLLSRSVSDDASTRVWLVVIDLLLGLTTLLLTLSLVSQFVLPVRNLQERTTVIGRLLSYVVGERGPVTFIRNGEAIESQRERQRTGAGVLLIDHASAAVLRTNTKFTRAQGPGIVFTARGERLAESLDLRRQVRSVKASAPPVGAPAEDQAVHSMAVTRDGIRVSANLNVKFMLDPGHGAEPREGRHPNLPPYEYNQNAVERAVYSHTHGDPGDAPWTELPLRLVVDLWREQIKAFHLNDLIGIDRPPGAVLQEIARAIKERLTSSTVEIRQDDGKVIREASHEYDVLKNRGIRILSVGVSDLTLPEGIRKEQLRTWREAWAGDVQEALADAELEVQRAKHLGLIETSALLTSELTSSLRQELIGSDAPNQRDTLLLVMRDAMRLCSQRGKVSDGQILAAHIQDILNDLEAYDANCRQPTARGGG